MEKSILVRRKAQKLAREGRTAEAIDQLRQLKSDAEVDPYDHVFIGDLLLRQGHREDAIDALMEAVESYRQVGLNRSAIAICKKILRLGDPPASVSRVLGELYLSEELHTEAVQHLLKYLDTIPADVSPPEEFFETLERVASISGLQVEAALRLSEHFQRVRREDMAARLLEGLADQAGSSDLAQDLREKARHLCCVFTSRQTPGGDEESCAGESRPPATDLGDTPRESLTFDIGLEEITGEDESSEGSEDVSGRDLLTTDHLGTADSQIEVKVEEAAEIGGEPDPETIVDQSSQDGALDPGGFEVEHFPMTGGEEPEIDEMIESGRSEEPNPDSPSLPAWQFSQDPEDDSAELPSDWLNAPAAEDADEVILDLDDDGESHQMLVEQAARATEAEDWNQARACYERLHLSNPLDRKILGSLLVVVRKMQDHAGEARCLIQLGDAWIAEEEYEKALEVFKDVVRLDPDNATGRRRLIRFREMGVRGADKVSEDGTPDEETEKPVEPRIDAPLQGVLESGAASVTVASEPAEMSDEWVDLGALLDEFKSGIQNQIDGDDFQSHYDLAVSHRSMGLHAEAIEELDSILSNEELPTAMLWSCRELRGACLADLGRHTDAIEEFRRALDLPVDDDQGRWSVLYNLARIMESAGEWREAKETYESLIAEAPGFLDAEQRLRSCRERSGPDSMAA